MLARLPTCLRAFERASVLASVRPSVRASVRASGVQGECFIIRETSIMSSSRNTRGRNEKHPEEKEEGVIQLSKQVTFVRGGVKKTMCDKTSCRKKGARLKRCIGGGL